MNGFLGTVSGKITTHSFYFVAETNVKKFEYVKLYHEECGFLLAQIIELINEENKITCECEVIGYRDSRNLLKIPNSTVNFKSEIFEADSEFIKKVLGLDKQEGLYIGLLDSYNMIKVNLDTKKLLTKHLAVLAKTGAGKSYSLGVIVEELIEKNIPCVIIDPHGEYSSLKYENKDEKELSLIHRYDISPKSYKDKIIEYSPDTSLNKDSRLLTIGFNSLTAQEIATLTPIKITGSSLGILFNAVVQAKRNNPNYSLDDIKAELDLVNSNSKYTVYSCIEYIENLGIFSNNPVEIEDLVNYGNVSLINLKGIEPQIQKIITAKLCNDLFEKRKKDEIPPLFLIIEEAHNFCPERNFGESPSSYILRNIASEGRKFGLGLGVVSQRPARIDKNVLSQCNTQIIQKVTNPNDLKAIERSAENINSNIINDISTLPIGVALIVGACAKPILVDIRVKRTQHGGKSVVLDYSNSKKYKKRINKINNENINKNKKDNVKEVISNDNVKKKINFINLGILDKIIKGYFLKVTQNYDEFNLLFDEHGRIIVKKGNDLHLINLNDLKNNNNLTLSEREKKVISLLKIKKKLPIGDIFNSFDYSFQDINSILKGLESKGVIRILKNIIILKEDNELNLSNYRWRTNYITKYNSLGYDFEDKSKILIDYLVKNKIHVINSTQVLIK